MITYKLYTGVKVKEAAELALKNRLYVAGWALCGEYVYLMNMHPERMNKNYRIVLAFDGDVPVGVMLHTNWSSLQAFVRWKYRRRGIGLAMAREMRVRPADCTAAEGASGSKQFWLAVGIDPLALDLR